MQTEASYRPKYLTRQVLRDPTFVHLRRELEQATEQSEAGAVLRWAVSAYDDAVRQRIRLGERLRSVLLDAADHRTGVEADLIEEMLTPSRAKVRAVPVPFLGSLHAEAIFNEQRMAALVELVVWRHPAWPWLREVRGIGPILAARLLSRLDIRRAPTPSSFWAYCGLATVPGVRYQCRRCGAVITGVAGLTEAPHHRLPDGSNCPSGPVIALAGGAARIGQPRPKTGESRRFDATARTACYLIGVSFARQGREYKALYDEQRPRLEARHPEWPRKRIVLTAQRIAVKRFLADLWVEWRSREGLPVVPPYALRERQSATSDSLIACAS